MDYLLYLMFRCDSGCDGKFGNFVGTKHTHGCARPSIPLASRQTTRRRIETRERPARVLRPPCESATNLASIHLCSLLLGERVRDTNAALELNFTVAESRLKPEGLQQVPRRYEKLENMGGSRSRRWAPYAD